MPVVINIEDEKKHTDARNYCEFLHYKGFSDWRLPTKEELMNLAKELKKHDPFKFSEPGGYWTIEEYVPDDTNSWAVYMPNGHAYFWDECEEEHYRCVR